jgi:hypothetical protein
MSAIMQFIEATFKPMVLVFVVANMGVLGLQAKIGEVIDTFKNKKQNPMYLSCFSRVWHPWLRSSQ